MKKSGEIRWLRISTRPIIAGNCVVDMHGVFMDITENKKMQDELIKTQKLESVGILAGGIAHDFNNILTGILGNLSLIRLLSHEPDAIETLVEAEKATVQAKDLTQQLLTFAKGGVPVKKISSLQELIKDSASFTLSGSKVKCALSIPEDLWPVEIDEGQIAQVINNIIINADQAMPEGGIMRLCAENIIIAKNHPLPLPEGRYIKVSIQDKGMGIPFEYLHKIFDPYFTTKQKGSGLGLAICYSIIKNHNGHITVNSELGMGTTFSLYLPASQKEIPQDKKDEVKKLLHGHGNVLVMDDEETVRDIAVRMLKLLGYEAETAKEGSEAIALYKQGKESGNPYDAVIMDLTIPGGMGGKEAIKSLLEIDPQVKVIVSSGYSNDPVMAEFKDYGFSGVISKPYDIIELSKVIHRVIETAES